MQAMLIGQVLHVQQDHEHHKALKEIQGLRVALKSKEEVLLVKDEGISFLRKTCDFVVAALKEE